MDRSGQERRILQDIESETGWNGICAGQMRGGGRIGPAHFIEHKGGLWRRSIRCRQDSS